MNEPENVSSEAATKNTTREPKRDLEGKES